MKIKDIIDEVIFEEKKEKGLNIFYDIDMLIQKFPEKESEEKPEEPEESEEPEEETKTIGNVLMEAILKTQVKGEIAVPLSDVENIQSLQDLVDYITDKKVSGKTMLNNVGSEIVLSLVDVGTKPLEEIVDKGDKIKIDIDYGKKKDNSIGFKVLKNAGTDAISIVMKKDNKVIPSAFQLPTFNQQLVLFRNSIV